MNKEKPVGTCPACGEAVFNSREPDGPVWTCPADLSPENPYHEDTLLTADEQAQNERDGFYGLCAEEATGAGCFERMPLHSACYEQGDY